MTSFVFDCFTQEKTLRIALRGTWLTIKDCLEMFQLDGYQKGVFKNREKGVVVYLFFVKTGVESILQDLK